jgi:hypothetical protein
MFIRLRRELWTATGQLARLLRQMFMEARYANKAP